MQVIQTTGTRNDVPAQEDLNESLYFVPLDFSDVSYQALQYAVGLAKETGGGIHLYHVTDMREVADSDNPIVVKRSLDRLEKQAATKLDSLREIITEAGVNRVTSRIEVGHVKNCIHKQIRTVQPDVIVVGKKVDASQDDALLASLLRFSNVPLLFVPRDYQGSALTGKHSLLVVDFHPGRDGALRRFLKFVQKTGQHLSVLHIQTPGRRTERLSLQKTGVPISPVRETTISGGRSRDIVNGIREHLQENAVDLVCAVHKPVPFWKKLFTRDWTLKLLKQASVPLLLISER